ncbi:hypothetical protein [Streptomyces sp. NPDC047981]|uniref:hypothetical protein n=1 Tax=Streptomyces sp. NPDC047981 TaxID=3154610 RepID=UPI0034271328
MIAGAGVLVALGLAVALVAVLQGGDDGGGGSADASSPAASVTATGLSAGQAEAHAVATRVAMAPQDWGAGYAKSEDYEADPADESHVTSGCEWVTRASRAGTLASVYRGVYYESSGNSSSTEVRVFTDAATAESYMRDVEANTHRCPSQHSGKSRWTGIREATAPSVTGFDEVVAEEGTQSADSEGKKTDFRYVYFTGRVGNTVLITIALDEPANAAALNKRGKDTLQELQQRLEAASTTAQQ